MSRKVSSRTRRLTKSLLPGAAFLSVLATGASGQGAAPPSPLAICVSGDDRSAGADNHFDAGIAQILAGGLNRPLRLKPILIPQRGGIGKALRLAFEAGECDIFLGYPSNVETRSSIRRLHLILSVPYWRFGYVLVEKKGASYDADAPQSREDPIGVVSSTPADLFLFQRELARRPYGSTKEVLEDVVSGKLTAGLVWSSALGSSNDTKRPSIKIKPFKATDEAMSADVVAVVKGTDAALLEALDAVIRAKGAEISKVGDTEGVPYVQ